MNNPTTEPHTGHIYLCLKSNRTHGTVKGKYYVYDSGEIKTYTSRNVTLLANGDEILEQTDAFELARKCPFCGVQTCDPFGGTQVIHDGVECAANWDARVKKYCRDCNSDLVAGKCPKCDEAESANDPSSATAKGNQ
jgi:hypothetical protein